MQTHLFSWEAAAKCQPSSAGADAVTIPPDNSAKDVFVFFLQGVSVKCILWQFVKAPLRMRVELYCGFYFSPAVMPDSRCVGVRFIHNGVWRFCRREFSKVPKCNSHNPAAIQIPSNSLFSLLQNYEEKVRARVQLMIFYGCFQGIGI